MWQFALIWQRQNSSEDAQLNPSSSCSLILHAPAALCTLRLLRQVRAQLGHLLQHAAPRGAALSVPHLRAALEVPHLCSCVWGGQDESRQETIAGARQGRRLGRPKRCHSFAVECSCNRTSA